VQAGTGDGMTLLPPLFKNRSWTRRRRLFSTNWNPIGRNAEFAAIFNYFAA